MSETQIALIHPTSSLTYLISLTQLDLLDFINTLVLTKHTLEYKLCMLHALNLLIQLHVIVQIERTSISIHITSCI